MLKEIIFSIFIIVMIFIGNGLTQKFTKAAVEDTSNQLLNIKEKILDKESENEKENNKNKDSISKDIAETHKQWDEKYEKLAFYLEHNELEKVETEFTDIQAKIKVEEYDEVIPEIDKCIFILRHIKEKNAFCLKNIF